MVVDFNFAFPKIKLSRGFLLDTTFIIQVEITSINIKPWSTLHTKHSLKIKPWSTKHNTLLTY